MRRLIVALILIAGLFPFAFEIGKSSQQLQKLLNTPTPLPPQSTNETLRVKQAILDAVSGSKESVPAYLIYQPAVRDLVIGKDGNQAAGWLVRANSQSGEELPIEPGLVLAQKDGENWKVILPSDSGWLEALKIAQPELVPGGVKDMLLEMFNQPQYACPATTLHGYLLPYARGAMTWLSQSVAHDEWDPSHSGHYAFDFYIQDTMFDLYASKGGTVWLARDSVPNNDHSSVNYLILQDNTTYPVTYQLYLHLAQGSIPPALHIRGTPVAQGQFIGVADNTGVSTGDHLHFMVHTNPDSYYGMSCDIAFDDVDINGGRPRVRNQFFDDFPWCWPSDVCVSYRDTYVSGNTIRPGDLTPPTGDLISPLTGDVIRSGSLHFTGWASDGDNDIAVTQIVANYGSGWVNIGPNLANSPISYDWDLCADEIPDGPISAALRLVDEDGNLVPLAGIKHFTKDYACPSPPPSCIPNSQEVTLFEGPDYSQGCVHYGIGDYTGSLNGLGAGDAESILVGSGVQATLYMSGTFRGRGETFLGNDNNLADNLIGANNTSSIQVKPRSQAPSAPMLLDPEDGSEVFQGDMVTLFWENGGGSSEYQVRLTGGVTSPLTSTWQTGPFLHMETPNTATYTWKVRSRNPFGTSAWSGPRTLRVVSPAPGQPPITYTVPYNDNMENSQPRWTPTGLWQLLSGDSNTSHSASHAWWYQNNNGNYDNSAANSGDLTSPPISVTLPGYYLRFWYRYDSETRGPLWDQRWIQISRNGGPFENLRQLYDDPFEGELMQGSWLQSPAIDLSPFTGTIRIRFHFETLDAFLNNHSGWGIDDLSITASPPPTCHDSHEPNNSPSQATPISYSPVISTTADICPGGDIDYYQFTGRTGDRIAADIDAQTIGSRLDSYLFLLDSNGVSVLAENDDEEYAVFRDSRLVYTLPHDGTYYLKVRAWDNPRAGGGTYYYRLHLLMDKSKPSMNVTFPQTGAYLPAGQVNFTAVATDTVSGISHIDFYWHDNDWLSSNWVKLGSDSDGRDGWAIITNTLLLGDQQGAALYVGAYDRADNWIGAGIWVLNVDTIPPDTSMEVLPPQQVSTAFKVHWTGSDSNSGIDHFDLQWTKDEGHTWENLQSNIDSNSRQAWAIGEIGRSYGFRLHGVDRAGNIEAYPSSMEISTTIPADICSAPDVWEGNRTDNTFTLASSIIPNGESQLHNFCNPQPTSHWLNDEDWVKFTAQAGYRYLIQGLPQADNVAVALSLYDANGNTLLKEYSPQELGQPSFLEWVAQKNGVLYVRIRHIDGRVAGNPVTYLAKVTKGYWVYLPAIGNETP